MGLAADKRNIKNKTRPSNIMAKNNQTMIAVPIPFALSLLNIDDKKASAVKTIPISIPVAERKRHWFKSTKRNKGRPTANKNETD